MTKVRLKEVEATIPTVQYGNIKPVVEIEGDYTDDARDQALKILKQVSDMTAGQGYAFEVRGLPVSAGRTVMQANPMKLYTSPLTGETIELQEVNGHKRLEGYMSGSRFPAQFFTPFDAEAVLEAIVKKYNVTASEVAAMWKLNNEASTGYGTAIHAALENYDRNHELGDKVKSVKTFKTKPDEVGPNKALSKNPFLKKIVEDFHEKFGGDYERINELFIWEDEIKLCGSIDRIKVIDREKRIIRIQDFKTDGDIHDKKYQKAASPFKGVIENTLLGYHWLQLSFYAHIMAKKGWTVEGLDIYWLNPSKLVTGENSWEEFSHDVIDITKGL